MQPSDADAYFGKVLREAKPSTRTGRAAALTVYFQFLELRHKIELHNLTGRVIECPLDEMNRPRTSVGPQLRIPPAEAEIERLFAGWRGELATCRKFAPAARNYAAARLAADVGLRINEARMLDLDDVRWELGRFGKLNVRHGKGSRRRGPKPRLVPLINGADRDLRWFIEDVWGQFDADHARPGAPLFPSERKCGDGSCSRATAEVFRRSLAEAAVRHLPAWESKLTPHVLRHSVPPSSTSRGSLVGHPGATRSRLEALITAGDDGAQEEVRGGEDEAPVLALIKADPGNVGPSIRCWPRSASCGRSARSACLPG